MKRLAVLLLTVASCAVLADVGLKNATTTIGPVRDLNCAADAGLYCTRNSTASRGDIRCITANATEPGCVTPSDQTWAGNKTFSGYVRLVGVAHASLTACASGTKGTLQVCTTHNAPVFCDGTTNIELLGGSQAEQVLASHYVNGTPSQPAMVLGRATLGSFGATVTTLRANWLGGSGASTLTLRVSDGSNNCDCAVSCSSPTVRTSCSGSCTFSASAALTTKVQANACTLTPVVYGNLEVLGTSP